MAKRASRKNLISLAEKLDDWAILNSVKNDSYVSRLSYALRNKENLNFWANLSALESLPFPTSNAGKSQSKISQILILIRNVLVFAPVALTWWAVSEATRGFSIYLAQNGENVVNFLDFWQNGYGVLGSEWRIANVAKLDFIIILIVIILTLMSASYSNRAATLIESSRDKIEIERATLALEIDKELFDYRKMTPAVFNQTMANSVSRLNEATKNLQESTKLLQKQIKDAKK